MDETLLALRRIERRDWHLWWGVFIVMVLLLVAVASLSLPTILMVEDPIWRINLRQNVRGLAALVLLFNVYAIYQQILIKRMRFQLLGQARDLSELRVRASEAESLAALDPLTGLYNRRLLETRLAAEMSRSQRSGHPLVVLLFDLNDFKQINDRFGHGAGDAVLKEFAERLKKASRGFDVAARIGGDEFLLLLPECAAAKAQRVPDRLGSLSIDWNGQKIHFSFSFGWADYHAGEPPEEFMARADQVLYKHKRSLQA
jgi:diguanylate cyclase (GGDEF)-like protein